MAGWLPLFSSPTSGLSKRSVINMNFQNTAEFAFIDIMKPQFTYGPYGLTWQTGANWNSSILDSEGYPNSTTADTRPFGGGIVIPSASSYSGQYIVDGLGSGRFTFPAGDFTFVSGTNCSAVTSTTSGVIDCTATGSTRWSATFTYAGVGGVVPYAITRTDPSAAGNFMRRFRMYRSGDASDLAAGKVFRSAYKQTLVDLCPSAIRFMNWTGNNDSGDMRFENRAKPGYAALGADWNVSPPYTDTSGTNQMTLGSATGMPVSMTHGEGVTCRIGAGMARCTANSSVGSTAVLSAITKANPGVVTCTAHGFNTGDVIVHRISAGMTELDRRPVTITVTDADHYSIGVNTTGYTTFTAGKAYQYITLNVGARGAYPVTFLDASDYASSYGSDYMATGDYKVFYFDSSVASIKDSAGNWVTGTWLFTGAGISKPHESQVPLEYCTALVNEVMAMSPAHNVDMWITTPALGMFSMDPDYSAASNFATNQVDVVLNGANGYSGLDSRCKLWVEYSNETWNIGFKHTAYLGVRGAQRWPGVVGLGDYASMVTLRSMVMVKDIQAAFPGNSRVKFVLSTQGTKGLTPADLGYYRFYGTASFLGDALNVSGAIPMSYHDAFAWAAYIENDSSNATYSRDTATTAWLAAGSDPVAKEAAYNLYVQGLKTFCGNETIDRYYDTLMPAYASAAVAIGKITIMYEGGWNDATASGQVGWSGSTDNSNFLLACKASQTWATALKNAHDKFNSVSGAYMPADYIEMDKRWGHAWNDSYGQAVGGVEWSGLDLAWLAMGIRNRALSP